LARPRRAEERPTPSTTLFAYSYTALELFRYAKEQGWSTVLGQIDPGPEEERIVQKEHQRYASIVSQWKPAPPSYWTTWRKELALADRVIVNSEWSRRCLMGEEGVEGKVEVLPLVYEESFGNRMAVASRKRSQGEAFQLLFLGQINLRKGMGRLLEAMRLLRDEPVELTLAGPTEISPDCWKDLPNVRWVGAVPRSGVSELYRKADAFILPTLSDGFALTQLEARSHGLPLLVSPHCGEVVKGTGDGWVMRDCEVESIVEVIRKAVSQHGERVTGRATTWRESMYSVEALSRRLLGEARR
jgi:glycosyltransferase involved in cell wall biosynthesis